jgi:ABC-type bacteriocin/lantibiotic exporter with double-glycine peptidase domain
VGKNASLLQSALCIALIGRQLGVQLPADRVEAAFDGGELGSDKSLQYFYKNAGVSTTFRRAKIVDLETRSYLLPCVALLNNGSSVVIASVAKDDAGKAQSLTTVDPFSATTGAQELSYEEFSKSWSGRLILVSGAAENDAQDRPFDRFWFLPEFVRFKWVLLGAFVISLILHALAFTPIIFIQIALDKVIGYAATSTLYVLTAGVILALLFGGCLGYVRDYTVRFITTAIEARISGDVFDKMLGLPVHSFQGSDASGLESGVLGSTTIRSFLVRQVITGVFDLSALIVFLPILFAYSTPLALLVMGFALTMGALSLFFKNLERSKSRAVSSNDQERSLILRDTIGGIDTVKTLSQESTQRREWRRASAASIRAHAARDRVSAAGNQVNAVLQQAMTVAIIFMGIQLVFGGSMSAGALIAVNMVGSRVVRPIVQAISGVAEIERFNTTMEQVSRIWNATPERRGYGTQRTIRGHYVLSNTTVEYDQGVRALDHVNLTIAERSTVAVVGPAGAGKSTLLRVLQGLLRATEGYVEVDGAHMGNLDLEHYRKQVALVTARPSFFGGTIEENLRRARPNISEREMTEALELSGLSDVLPQIPDGLGARITHNAGSLPSAFRQLLGIARALASAPKVLLFDEVLSSLDKRAQLSLWSNMSKMAEGRTVILVTQDLRFASRLEHIIVMDGGKMVGEGKHAELLAACPTYKEMWEIEAQLSADGGEA